MKRKDIKLTREEVLNSLDKAGVKYVRRDDNEGLKFVFDDGTLISFENYVKQLVDNTGYLEIELKRNSYLFRENCRLNKLLECKNKYIRELEDALHGNENYIHSLEEQLKFVRE